MKKVCGLLFVWVLLIFIFSAPARAQVIRSSNADVAIAADETIEDDLFLSGENVVMAGTVKGDLFVGGSSVKVTGRVEGDLFAGGGLVDIKEAKIGHSVIAGAGRVVLSGSEVGGSVIAGGGSVSIDNKTRVGGMFLAGGTQIKSDANIGRGLMAGGGTVDLGGRVEKDLRVGAGLINLSKDIQVGGDFVYSSDQEVVVPATAEIAGQTRRIFPAREKQGAADQSSAWQRLVGQFNLGYRLWSYLASLLVGAVILALFPQASPAVASKILQKPWQSLGVGFLSLLLIAPLVMFLLLTVVGIPLALLLALAFGAHVYLTKIFVGLLFGRSLLELFNQNTDRSLGVLALGLLVFYILTGLPFFGFLIGLASLLFGLGAMLIYERQQITGGRA